MGSGGLLVRGDLLRWEHGLREACEPQPDGERAHIRDAFSVFERLAPEVRPAVEASA